jgi:hypothetical protein
MFCYNIQGSRGWHAPTKHLQLSLVCTDKNSAREVKFQKIKLLGNKLKNQ